MITCRMKRVRDRPPYKYCTTGISMWKINENDKIIIPKGFLTDGSTSSPDAGFGWVFHDYLYATHQINGRQITRKEADKILIKILKYERSNIFYRFMVNVVFKLNPFKYCSKAWNDSGQRGAEYIDSLHPSSSIDNILANLAHIQQ